MFVISTWSLHLTQFLLYISIYIYIHFRFYHYSIMLYLAYIFSSSIIYIMHAPYIPKTDAYSALHHFMMQVQVINIQITLRLTFGPYSTASVVNPHIPRKIDMCFLASPYSIFSLARVGWGHVRATLVNYRFFIHSTNIKLTF